VGVSRKIESADERAQLRKLIQKSRQRGGGYIVRTAAEGKDEEAIVADLRYLEQKWQEIGHRAEQIKAPALIHRDLGLVFKYIRDVLSTEYSAIRINSEELFDQVLNYVRQIQPQMLHRVKYYSKNYPIFEEYGVQAEIDKALRSKVWLKSGGYIVINQTEALVAIDINTGRYTGDRRLEDTITRINLEAVEEIVHQIRLRDLGGIIVIDFIDMEERRNQQRVFHALEQALRKDRSPTKSVQINEFGLVVLTRKRVKRSLERVLCRPCPHCQGSSWVKSPTTVAFEIVDQVRKSLNEYPKGLTVRVHPEVARALKGKEAPVIEELKSMVKQEVDVRADASMYEEQYELVARK
jgi:ribonuclease G